MATIGTFTKNGDGYVGGLHTLAFSVPGIVIKPVEEPQRKASSPTHRVYAGQAEIGAAWEKTSKAGSNYLSVMIDDPSLASAINANLVKADTSEVFDLIWSRKRD